MAASMEFIARLLADGSTDTMTFTSIPQTFTDVWVVGCAYSDYTVAESSLELQVRPNSDATGYYMSQLGVLYNGGSPSQRATYIWGDSSFKMPALCPTEHANLKYPSSYFNLYIANYTDSWNSGTDNYMNIYGNGAGFTGPRTSHGDTTSRQGGLVINQGTLGATTAVMPMTSLRFEVALGNFEAGSVITLYGIDAS